MAPSDPGLPASSEAPRNRPRKNLRRALLAAAVLVLAGIALRALLPVLAERAAAYGFRQYLGLPARIGNVDFYMLSGRVVLEDVTVGSAADEVDPLTAAWSPPEIKGQSTMVHCDRMALSISWRALLSGIIRVTGFSIESPTLLLQREPDGRIDPLLRAKPLAKQTSPAGNDRPAKLWPVEINQFSLKHPNVVIGDAASGKKLMEFSLEEFVFDNVSITEGNLALGAVQIQGPVLRLRKDLVLPSATSATAAGSPAPSPAAAASDSAAPAYRLRDINIRGAEFTWLTDEGPLDVMLTLKASGVSAEQGQAFPLEVALKISGGDLGLKGEASLFPPAFRGTLSWSGLRFPPLLLASVPELASWLKSGDSSGNLRLDAALSGAGGNPEVRISGRSQLDSLKVSSPGGDGFDLEWQQLEAVVNEVFLTMPGHGGAPFDVRASFDLIRLSGPSLRYRHPCPPLVALLGLDAPAAGPAPRMEFSVGRLEVAGGNLELQDGSVKPAADVHVRDLSVSASGLGFPDPQAAGFSVRATLPLAASLTLEGSLKPGLAGDLALSLNRLELPPFSPYAMAAGATLDAGQASLETRLQAGGGVLKVDTDLVLSRFGVSLRDPASFSREFGMPIDLALALLCDPAGDIRLKIPLQMDEKGTRVSPGPIVASAIRAALIGAVSTPLKLLGATLGDKAGPAGDRLAIAPVKCAPGSIDPDPATAARVDSLVKLLSQKPGMSLLLRGRTGPADQPMVAEAALLELLESGKGLPEVEGSGLLGRHKVAQALTRRAKGANVTLRGKDQQLFERYLAAAGQLEERFIELAKRRAENVRSLLIAKGVSPKRIAIGDREAPGDPGVVISFKPSQPERR